MNKTIALTVCAALGTTAFACTRHEAEPEEPVAYETQIIGQERADEDAIETQKELRASAQDRSREAHIDALEDRLDAAEEAVDAIEDEQLEAQLSAQAEAIDDDLDALDDDFGETLGNRPKADDYASRAKAIEQAIASLEKQLQPTP